MWAIAAVSAAMFWGLCYAVCERLLKTGFAPGFIMAVSGLLSVPVYTLLALQKSDVPAQINIIKNNPKWLFLILFTSTLYITANYLVFWAIKNKNATSVNLIEISYPIFTALFVWLLYREVQINWGISVGALLILCGMACVIIFSDK